MFTKYSHLGLRVQVLTFNVKIEKEVLHSYRKKSLLSV